MGVVLADFLGVVANDFLGNRMGDAGLLEEAGSPMAKAMEPNALSRSPGRPALALGFMGKLLFAQDPRPNQEHLELVG